MAETSLQIVQPGSQIQANQPQTFAPRTLQEAIEFAKLIADSGMVPKDYINRPGAIVVALQMGMEVGLQPMQALQSIAVINGRPSIWGDGALAIVKTHPEFEGVEEQDLETIKKNKKATCIVKRRGQKDVVVTFGEEDAVTAGLWKKAGPWTQYPFRMMQMRARSFAIRDQFPDALKGIVMAEEASDYPGQTLESTSLPQNTSAPAATAATVEETVGTEGGSMFYKTWKAHGWTKEEAVKFLADTFQIGAPHNDKDSRSIPKARFEEAKKWASTKAPVRVEADKLLEDLGWTTEEKTKFVEEQKWNWPAIVEALKAEINKRNAQESGGPGLGKF